MIAYDDSDTTQNNKINKIIHNYIDLDKFLENMINTFIKNEVWSKKQIDQYKSMSKNMKIEYKRELKIGLEVECKFTSIGLKKLAGGRKIIIDIDDIKYLNGDKADVTYTIKADDKKLLDKYHAILEKIDNKWKIISIIPSASDMIKIKNFHQLYN